jgi:hypothetical protein
MIFGAEARAMLDHDPVGASADISAFA